MDHWTCDRERADESPNQDTGEAENFADDDRVERGDAIDYQSGVEWSE